MLPQLVNRECRYAQPPGMFPLDPDVVATELDAGGVPADWVTVQGFRETERVVLYFHGGAYVMGSKNTHRGIASRIARAAQARVLLPDYRLAPEQPFPAAVEDAMMCWRWLVAEGNAPHHMAIAGDSAGGGFALATLLALKTSGRTLAAPLHGDLQDLPPLLLQVGTREVLLSDSTRFADKAQTTGVEATLEIEEGLIHVWQMLPGVPEAESAIQRIGSFIQRNC